MGSNVPDPLSQVEFSNVIGGGPRGASKEGGHHQVEDPRTEAALWDAPVASAQDLDDAVEAGHQAFRTWGKSTLAERTEVLNAVAKVLYDNDELLTGILMRETGKSRIMAHMEVQRAAFHYEYYAKVQLADEIQYEDDDIQIIGTHEPYGVIGAISPWNFPLILSSVKVASALATGNCVIIKPSPFTPYAILKFCELAQSVLPARGIFQALNGGADVGERMTLHRGIAHISFTGTIAVGQRIMANCASTLKKVILELAGNDAAIVTDDVDLDTVVPKVALGCLLHAGQMCVASKRLYVHASRYDDFVAAFRAHLEKTYVATYEDAEAPSVFGPLSNRPNFDRCRGFVEDCRKNGYEVITAGAEVSKEKKGLWMAPTIIANPPEDSLVVREEQFGPVVPIMKWTDESDVIARANLDNAGLGASIWCRDADRARKLARQLETGTVFINQPPQPHHAGYFAGQKLSGVGGELGKQGLLSYCQTKSLHIGKK
ncbi:aldehyde dehydrogenase [Apiospora rasikravindrae]|uniref:aldehyde dehydrogenase (NAD(+)) n=1 Tax=Apiospora rasikravindrae TaxID=990691 RepID=A0ABR1T036_9PEZI